MKSLIKTVVGGILTAALVYVCWMIWDTLPDYLRGTVFWDYRTLTRVLLIFLLLTLVEIPVVRLWSRIFPDGK